MIFKYADGEACLPGDVVSLREGNGLKVGVVCLCVGEQGEGAIGYPADAYDGVCVRVTHETTGATVQEFTPPRVVRDVPPERLHLVSRGPGQAHYLTGEPVRNGDVVAVESDEPEIGTVVIYKSDDLFSDGSDAPVLMIHSADKGYVAHSYLNDEGLLNLGVMQQIHFLCRGRVHAEDVW